METTYLHRYTPPFYYGNVVSSVSEQTVRVSAEGIGSVSFAAALFFGGRLGVRFSTCGFESSVTGTTTTDRMTMTYIAKQPPDYVDRAYSVGSESHVAAPYGLLRARSFNLEAVFRLGRPGRFALDVSGGLALLRFDADLKTFGYTRFWLGGHAVLFSDQALLSMGTAAATRLGAGLGATAALPLAPFLDLFLEGRYIFGPETGLPVRFSIMQGTGELYPGEDSLEGLNTGATPLEVNPSFLTVGIGLRLRIGGK
jgi:hypothetical protein